VGVGLGTGIGVLRLSTASTEVQCYTQATQQAEVLGIACGWRCARAACGAASAVRFMRAHGCGAATCSLQARPAVLAAGPGGHCAAQEATEVAGKLEVQTHYGRKAKRFRIVSG